MKFATTFMMAAALFLSLGFSSAAKIRPVLFGASEHSQLPTSLLNGMQPNPATNYIVKPGQTLTGLAQAYNTTPAALEQNNPSLKSNNNQLFVGERLTIPNAQEGPTVVVAPTSGVPGTQIEVVLGGFPANTDVQLALDQITCSQRSLISLKTDQNGQLTTQMTIPQLQSSAQEYQRLGQWDVVAVAQSMITNSSMNSGSSSPTPSTSSGSTMSSGTSNSASGSSSTTNNTMNNSSNNGSSSQSNSSSSGNMTNSGSSSSSQNSTSGANGANTGSLSSSATMIVVSSNVFDGSATSQPPIPNQTSGQ